MKYMGSKNRLSKDIAPIIQSYITQETKGYIEPFVGGANMIDKIECDNKYGYDNHKYLISFLKELANGWTPPLDVPEEKYKYMKTHQEEFEDHLLGYVGFQLSYGAKWFDTYRRDKQGIRNYSHEAYRNVLKQQPKLKGINFECCDFREIKNINNFVIYCDPPYKGTANYATGEFPYEDFYDWCREMSRNNTVLISEYDMPSDFTCIWSKETKCLMYSSKEANDEKNNRVEKIFTYKI